jgi:hypothetical protein
MKWLQLNCADSVDTIALSGNNATVLSGDPVTELFLELSCKGIRRIVSLGIGAGFWHMRGLLHISEVFCFW